MPKNKPIKGRFSNLNTDESDAGVTGDSDLRDVGNLFVENFINWRSAKFSIFLVCTTFFTEGTSAETVASRHNTEMMAKMCMVDFLAYVEINNCCPFPSLACTKYSFTCSHVSFRTPFPFCVIYEGQH